MGGSVAGINLGHRAEVIGGVITNHFGVPVITGNYVNISLQLNILGYDHACISVPKLVSTFPFDCWWQVPSFPGVVGRGQITIGNDVWIGQSVTLRPGITIGDGAIVGGGSVVTKDVPPFAIVAGNPIKILRYRFTPEQIEKLLEIKWWNWSEEKIKRNYELFGDIEKFVTANFKE